MTRGTPASVPDLRRPETRLGPRRDLPGRALALAQRATHRVLGPRGESFTAPAAPLALEAVPYDTEDGWRCFLYRVPPDGDPGEPVVLAHGLGFNRFSLDFHPQDSLLPVLRDAGFDPWILEHRADPSAFPPRRPGLVDLDEIARFDVPAAVALVRRRTGFRRVGWVGHGLGGHLLYAFAAQEPSPDVFAAATLGTPVVFPVLSTLARQSVWMTGLLPGHVGLPSRTAIRLAAPFARPLLHEASPEGALPGPVLRGILDLASEDLSAGLVAQVGRWLACGAFTDRTGRVDWTEALTGADLPLLVVASPGDVLCPPAAAEPAIHRPTAPTRLHVTARPWSHLELVQGGGAAREVAPVVVDWLDGLRALAR